MTAVMHRKVADTPHEETLRGNRLIRHIIDRCPRRVAGSASEARALEILAQSFQKSGARTRFHDFRFSTHLYANLALHFGLASLASVLFFFTPWVAMVLHLIVGISYVGDTTRKFLLLRRFFPFVPCQNLLATLPAARTLRRRIVLIAHVDAAYTGRVFDPEMVRQSLPSENPILNILRRSMLVATASVFMLAGVDLAVGLYGTSNLWVGVLVTLLSVPSLLTAFFNADVVWRDEVVPGANDNLSGCAAGVLLAKRLANNKPEDVEIVFVVTSCEEAGTGGSLALAKAASQGWWPQQNTVVLAIDGLSNGDLRYFLDGELGALPLSPWLQKNIDGVVAGNPRYEDVTAYEIPSGATDAMPFLAHGYAGVGIGCIDPTIGAPRHYHLPTDTPENLDLQQLALSVDFVEDLVYALAK